VVRDVSPLLVAHDDDAPRVAASLFGDRDAGRSRLARVLPTSPSVREAWFAGYVDALVPATLHLFFHAGLMFEPHLQNVLVSGFPGGGTSHADAEAPVTPVRVFLRDFDNAKIVDGLFDRARLERVPRDVASELVDSFDRSWERFVYCLFVNDLAEVAGALAGGDLRLEARLWSSVHHAVAAFRSRESSTHVRRALADLLQRPTLPAKANFLTRLFDRDDRVAPFVGVPNPLAAVSRATRRAPIAQGADATWQ
jgi:siderophore synthetase component